MRIDGFDKVKEVAEREVRTRGRTKAFKVITAILLLAAIAGPIIAALWPDDGDDLREVTIGLAAGVESGVRPTMEAIAEDQLDITWRDLSSATAEEIEAQVGDGDVDVVIEPGPTLFWDEEPDFEIGALITFALQQQESVRIGTSQGLSNEEVARLFTPLEVGERFVDERDSEANLSSAVAFIGLLLAFIVPQAFGQLTLLSVVEEKSTRVIEVLLSHIRPRTLLAGKIIGLGVLALLQIVVIITGLVVALVLTDAVDVPASIWRFVPILLVSLLAALAIYNTMFALLGSLISRQEDASQVMMPVFIPLMAGYIFGQQAVFGDASSLLVRILTWFPLTAPMLLPVRVARDAIETWEVVAVLGVIVVSAWLLLRLAGRVYEFALLQTGSRIGWGEVVGRLRRAT